VCVKRTDGYLKADMRGASFGGRGFDTDVRSSG
jgi:hypothetical protein